MKNVLNPANKMPSTYRLGIDWRKALLYLTPLLLSLGISALFYPGFMSYDTLHALRGARNGVTDSMWPPMVSYVWRVVDMVSLNPVAMHFTQVFLLLGSVFYSVSILTKSMRSARVFLLIYLCIPVVLGSIAVIWKDVLMAAFFMFGFALILSTHKKRSLPIHVSLLLLAAFSIFLGICSRHNAIAGAIPLLFLLAWAACSRVFRVQSSLWLGVMLLGSLLTSGFYFTKTTLLDNYSLPSFGRIDNTMNIFIQSVRVLDVAGASICVGSNLFGELVPNLSLNEIQKGYDPRHINLSRALLDRVGTDDRINQIWVDVAIQHPFCFFNNKIQVTKYLVGANLGKQYLVTAPAIDVNEYGYSLPKSFLRSKVVSYISNFSIIPFFKPWFLYLASIFAAIYMFRIKAFSAYYFSIYVSAILYFGGSVAMGNAADGRLLFYTTTAITIFTFVAILEYKKRHE